MIFRWKKYHVMLHLGTEKYFVECHFGHWRCDEGGGNRVARGGRRGDFVGALAGAVRLDQRRERAVQHANLPLFPCACGRETRGQKSHISANSAHMSTFDGAETRTCSPPGQFEKQLVLICECRVAEFERRQGRRGLADGTIAENATKERHSRACVASRFVSSSAERRS